MEYDIEKINRLLKGMTPRKISIISRLAGLNAEEIALMRMKWLDGKSDTQICEAMNISQATLTRKRRAGHIKLLSGLDLYGLSDVENLPIHDVFDYEGYFYKAQDYLVRYFLHNHGCEEGQRRIVEILRVLSEV